MAIVQMKRLRAIALSSRRDALLKELQLLGCVELTTQDWTQEVAPQFKPDHGDLVETQAARQLFSEAVEVLERHVPQKKPMLSAKPEISTAELLDESDAAELTAAAKELTACSEQLKSLASEQTREKLRIETLLPWKTCPIPLDCAGTKHVAVLFGSLPVTADMDALSAALTEQAEATALFEVSADPAARYIYLFYLRAEEERVFKLLREHGFASPGYGEAVGSAAAGIERAEARLAAIASEEKKLQERIAALAGYRERLQICCDRAGLDVDRAEAAGRLLRSERTVLLEGWAVADREAEISALLDRFDCAYEYEAPAEEEYPDVPVKLRNNIFTNGLNMITNMYSLPQYGTVDPNPLMAPFYILFFGIMMADMGYGILMILASIVVCKKMKPRGGMSYFDNLLFWCGVSTLVFGALTASFFSDAAAQIAQIFNPESTFEWFWPALFTPLNDSIFVLVLALALGVLQLNAGLVVSFVQKLKHGDTLDGLLYEAALWVNEIGAVLLVLGGGMPGKIILIIGVVALFGGSMRGKKGLGKFTAIFGTLYNELTGWFGDILSYSRIMALMLAGSVIGQVFNTIGAMFGNIVIFALIFIVGHALNFGLNLLSCYVHDLRLQCLEYFGKFYVDGGKAFAPLEIRTNYVNVNK